MNDHKQPIGTVAQLWRYPVKSMHGESLPSLDLTPAGAAGDRLFAFESQGAPSGMLRLTGRERRELLRYRASYREGRVQVTTPGGTEYPVEDPALIVGFPAFTPTRLTYELKPQTDCRPLALISLQTVKHLEQELGTPLDPRRFRANLYLNLAAGAFSEDDQVGQTLTVGQQARIRILERDPRCRFITLDPETAEPNPLLMALLHRKHDSRAGVYASIVQPGPLRIGDTVYLA